MEDRSRVALVTGAASGIGRASALAFAAAGAAVAVSDVDEEGGRQTAALIAGEGGRARFISADISAEPQVSALIEQTVSHFGGLDSAHNNAGIGGPPALVADYPRDAWDQVVSINLTGTWLCMKHEIGYMKDHGGGAIVNTASTFGLVGVPGMCAYVAAKHGIVGLTRGAALEYARADVRVNAVCPGATRTPQLEDFFRLLDPDDPDQAAGEFESRAPVGRLGSPTEIAAAVVWLCSDAASFVTGLPMPVDGGWVAQ
jgi:NAD(P)-dependent dehydrogenase (short-subunit alcohol dehydrogenase family)